jgi:hypothetical protein
MRLQICIIVAVGVAALGAPALAASDPQPNLKRPVDAPVVPEISLGELATQVNPERSAANQKHVYTNADLKLRPAPVPPTTPPFPEIAPARGILEHAGEPDVDRFQFEPVPQGIPLWDFTTGVGFLTPGIGRQRTRPTRRPFDDPFNRLGLFNPGFGLRSGSLPAPIGSGPDLFTVGRGGRSFGGFSTHDRIGMQGRPRPAAPPSSPRGNATAPITRSAPGTAGKPR